MVKNEILVCGCSSMEHQIVISHIEKTNVLYCSIHLSPNSFWNRLKAAIRYIFGYKCKYGNFEEFILIPEHADKIEKIKKILSS